MPITLRRVHYAWIVVAVTFLVLLASGGIRSVPGILILPLENEFGWDRATISLAVSINLLLFGLCGPFAASIVERIGTRRLVSAALITLAVGVGLTTQMRASWHLHLLWGVLVGLGSGAIGAWLAATVANRWFVERRGLVTGLLMAAGASGQIIFLPLLAAVVVAVGWRVAALLVAGVALLVVPLVGAFMRSDPQEIGIQPYGAPVPMSSPATLPAMPQKSTGNPFLAALDTLRRCFRDRNFLLLAGSFFVCGASANGLLGTHMIPASIEHGMPEVAAAGLFGVMGMFNIAGPITSGWLSDRFDCRRLLAL